MWKLQQIVNNKVETGGNKEGGRLYSAVLLPG